MTKRFRIALLAASVLTGGVTTLARADPPEDCLDRCWYKYYHCLDGDSREFCEQSLLNCECWECGYC